MSFAIEVGVKSDGLVETAQGIFIDTLLGGLFHIRLIGDFEA